MPLFIRWSNEISVQDSVLDAQHQQILRVINDLFDAISAGQTSKEELGGLLYRLQIFTVTHFQCEEAYMKYADCPFYKEHSKLHRIMAQKTELFTSHLERGDLDPGELLRFLKDWWLSHIRKSDMEYVSYVTRIGL